MTRHAPVRRGRAADIGTRDGTALKVLGEMGWQATGFDPDDRFHRYARERFDVEIRAEWFTAEAVGPGTLDLVTAYHVLEHVREPLPWLFEVCEALKPDGWLQIDTPNLRRLQPHRQIHLGHTVLYSAHTLRQLLEKAGFRVVAITENAPGGNRTYDQLGVAAQRDHPKAVSFSLGPVDRSAQRHLEQAEEELPPSTVLPVRALRGVRRRIREGVRRARYHLPF